MILGCARVSALHKTEPVGSLVSRKGEDAQTIRCADLSSDAIAVWKSATRIQSGSCGPLINFELLAASGCPAGVVGVTHTVAYRPTLLVGVGSGFSSEHAPLDPLHIRQPIVCPPDVRPFHDRCLLSKEGRKQGLRLPNWVRAVLTSPKQCLPDRAHRATC